MNRDTFVDFLRSVRIGVQNDVVAASSELAGLLRLIAAEIDGSTHADINTLVLAGVALEVMGVSLRDAALAA